MKNILNKIKIHKIFEVGLLLKAFFGIFEILSGVLIMVTGHKIIDNFVIFLTQQEIAEDPSDFLANSIIKLSNNFSQGSQFFAVFYLLFHGIINVFLIAAMLKNKLWAYPSAIALFSAFIAYQLYRYFHTFSLFLLSLIIFDIFVVVIIWLEYGRHKKRLDL